jgi:hypothetical protein
MSRFPRRSRGRRNREVPRDLLLRQCGLRNKEAAIIIGRQSTGGSWWLRWHPACASDGARRSCAGAASTRPPMGSMIIPRRDACCGNSYQTLAILRISIRPMTRARVLLSPEPCRGRVQHERPTPRFQEKWAFPFALRLSVDKYRLEASQAGCARQPCAARRSERRAAFPGTRLEGARSIVHPRTEIPSTKGVL